MTTFLDSSWPLICLVTYVVIVAALLIGNHRWVTLNRADITRRAQYPPPVPPSCPRGDDARWLDAWASAHPSVHNLDVDEVRALLSEPQSKEQIDRRCHEILAIEGLSS